MLILSVKAKSTGRLVSWKHFKRGEWVDENRFSWSFTTVIPDVIEDVRNLCQSIDKSCATETISPNGFTTAHFDISMKGEGFQVACSRRLVRGFFPLNPIAAEFGSNYDVLVTISVDDPAIQEKFERSLGDKYECKKM